MHQAAKNGEEMSTEEIPLGIKMLTGLTKVMIRQKVTTSDNNKYVVLAPDASVVFYAKENSGILDRVLGGKSRAFEINIFDTEENEVIRLRRPFTMGLDVKMDVSVCGKAVSVVRKEVTFCKPIININDASDKPAFRVKGPMIPTNVCDFELFTTSKQRIGVISKKWSGTAREAQTSSDNYVIEFPVDLDVCFKAAVIGTCLLIVCIHLYL
ncbi:unnamed protein product [Parnassius apollo]|uniref:Phospholipid scramblase n=1 Tax=Parnassius apollo TaxID=110799 RepID=A0A8S3WB93_PARAO|nr:unnamed protein product [Parnassius apollo]